MSETKPELTDQTQIATSGEPAPVTAAPTPVADPAPAPTNFPPPADTSAGAGMGKTPPATGPAALPVDFPEVPTTLPVPQKPPPILNPSLKQLDAMLRQPITVTITFTDGRPDVVVDCHLLRPSEAEMVHRELGEKPPPLTRDLKTGQLTPDWDNAAWREERMQCERHARAVAVYLGVPMIHDEKPGLRDSKQIIEFVESVLTDSVLNKFYEAIYDPAANARRVEEMTDFFS